MKSSTSKITRILRAACCALAVSAASIGLPQAQASTPSAEQLAAYGTASEPERVRLLIHLAKSGDGEAVETLLADFPLQGNHAANRQLYIEGLVLRSRGDLTGAAEKFRAALASDPSLTMVRADLAETLVMLQQDDSAKHHLRLLAADAPDEQAAAGIRSFIDKVDARRPYKFSGYVSFAPSTNLNSGSKHSTVYSPTLGTNFSIDDDSRAKSGLGVATGASAAYNKRLGNDFMFVAAGSVDARLYDNDDFNSYSLSQSLEMRHLLQQGYVGLGMVSSQSLDNDGFEPDYISFGPRISASIQVTAKDHMSLGVVHEWRESLVAGGPDSTAVMLDGSWTHAWNSSFTTTLFGGFDRINAESEISSYQTVSGGLSFYKELPLGITANLTGQAAMSDFDGFSALAGTYRADKRLTGSISLTKRDLNLFGFAPSLSYSYSENFSNINLYDFNTHAVDVRLTKEF